MPLEYSPEIGPSPGREMARVAIASTFIWMRVRATVVLVVREGRALVLRRRADDRGFAHMWCLPGGRIEEAEAVEAAARRETLEETRLEVNLDRTLGVRELAHRGVTFEIHLFVSERAEGTVALSEEHVAHRWLDRAEASRADALLPGGLAGETTRELLRRFSEGELPSARARS